MSAFSVGSNVTDRKKVRFYLPNLIDIAQEVELSSGSRRVAGSIPTLGVSKCPWARHLTPDCSWRAGWYLAWQPIAVGVWMCVWMGEWEASIVQALWIKALYKCSPFTIYHYLRCNLFLLNLCCNDLAPWYILALTITSDSESIYLAEQNWRKIE